MTRRAVVHASAELEINEAAAYYNDQWPGLGADFLDEYGRALAAVLEHPQAATPVLGAIRRKLVQRFPFAIIYWAGGDDVRVLAVANLRRRPFYWSDRA